MIEPDWPAASRVRALVTTRDMGDMAGAGRASLAGVVPADPAWLTAGEAERAAGLRYTKRRTEYLLRRLAAKHAVAAAVGLSARPGGRPDAATLAQIEIRNHPTGAPYVLLDGSPCGLEVSISDRAGWAVCLVSLDAAAVGCDLELVEPRSPGFLRDFLTDIEQGYVAAQPDRDARDVLRHAAGAGQGRDRAQRPDHGCRGAARRLR